MSEIHLDCDTCTEHLDEYRRGTLSEQISSAVREHLVSCADCRAELQAAEQLGDLLRRSVKQTTAAHRPDLEAIAAAARAQVHAESSPPSGNLPLAVVWGMAAALILVVGSAVLLLSRHNPTAHIQNTRIASAAKERALVPSLGPAAAGPLPEQAATQPQNREVRHNQEQLQSAAIEGKQQTAEKKPETDRARALGQPAIISTAAVASRDDPKDLSHSEVSNDPQVKSRLDAIATAVSDAGQKVEPAEKSQVAGDRQFRLKEPSAGASGQIPEQPGSQPRELAALAGTAAVTPSGSAAPAGPDAYKSETAAQNVAFRDLKFDAISTADKTPQKLKSFPAGAKSQVSQDATGRLMPAVSPPAARGTASRLDTPQYALADASKRRAGAPSISAPAPMGRAESASRAPAAAPLVSAMSVTVASTSTLAALRTRATGPPSASAADAQLRLAELLYDDAARRPDAAMEYRKCLAPGLIHYYSEETVQDIRAKLATLASEGTAVNSDRP
jgi:hypothetical protein